MYKTPLSALPLRQESHCDSFGFEPKSLDYKSIFFCWGCLCVLFPFLISPQKFFLFAVWEYRYYARYFFCTRSTTELPLMGVGFEPTTLHLLELVLIADCAYMLDGNAHHVFYRCYQYLFIVNCCSGIYVRRLVTAF